MELGVIIPIDQIEEKFQLLNQIGIGTCQVLSWDFNMYITDSYAEMINRLVEKYNIKITALWACWSGPQVWNFYEGPHTLGLVPVAYRFQRLQELIGISDFAKKIGVTDIITHVGFLPEVPTSYEYASLLVALKELAQHCKKNNQYFLFETGQETPVTLLRTIEDIGTDNLGINLDPANLICYGKANPIDALDIFGKYVRNVHAKDAFYPTDGKHLGKEARLGEGRVDYPNFIKKLKSIGYDGPLTIEREISGEKQIKDIMWARDFLTTLIKQQ